MNNSDFIEITVPLNKLPRLSFFLFFSLLILCILPFYSIFGWNILKSGLYNFFLKWETILAVIFGIILHEILHLFVFIISGQVGFKSLKMGINKDLMSPYVHIKKPVKINVYRISACLPAIVLGIFPIIVGFYLINAWYIFFGIIFFVGSIADLYMIWMLYKYSGKTYVLDHEEMPGCYIVNKQNY